FSMSRPPPISTLFPYTTLFRSEQLEAIWKVLSERSHRERHRSIAYVRLLDDAGLRKQEAWSLPLDDLRLTSGNRGSVRVRLSASDRKSTRLNSSHLVISYAVFC